MLRVCSPIETLVSSAIVPPTNTNPLASTARCMIGVRMLRMTFMMSSSWVLGCGRMKAVDAEIADPCLGAAVDDQLRHHGAGAGAELEAMQRKAELVIEALVTGARPKDGQIILCPGLDAGPGADDRRSAHHRKQFEHGARADSEAAPIQHGLVAVLVRRRQMTAADQHGAVGELLEGQLAAAQDHHRIDEVRHA